MTMEEAGLFTTTQAAALLAERGITVKPDTIKHWIAQGRLKAQRIGGERRGYWLIRREDIEAFEQRPVGRPARPTPPEGGRAEGE